MSIDENLKLLQESGGFEQGILEEKASSSISESEEKTDKEEIIGESDDENSAGPFTDE